MSSKKTKVGWGIAIGVCAFVVVVLFATGALGPADDAVRLWLAGAMGLGFSVGITTGMSNQPGSAQEFLKFASAGVMVPIFGAIAALLEKSQEVKEVSRYDGTQLIERTTNTVTSFSNGLLNPFAVLGLFFVGFASFAALGIATGILLRKGGVVLPVAPPQNGG